MHMVKRSNIQLKNDSFFEKVTFKPQYKNFCFII